MDICRWRGRWTVSARGSDRKDDHQKKAMTMLGAQLIKLTRLSNVVPTLCKLGSAAVAILLMAGQAQAANVHWIVYGDYGNTVRSNNVNRFDTRVTMTTSFPLTNFITGTYVTNTTLNDAVRFFSTNIGTAMTAATECTNPTTGPLTAYTNILNFGGANNVTVNRTLTNRLVFYNLDPNLQYKFIAGISRGKAQTDASYTNRWSRAWLNGADAYTASHQADPLDPYGILTAANEPTILSGSEVAYWTAGKFGNVIEWDAINVGSDGTVSFDTTQFYSADPVTSHGAYTGQVTPNSGSYGYGWDGWALIAEDACSSFAMGFPLETDGVTNITQCVPFSMTMVPSCAVPPYTFGWNKVGETEDRSSEQTLVLQNPNPDTDNGSWYAIFGDSANNTWWLPFTINITADVTAPTLSSSAVGTDLEHIRVSFSRAVNPESVTSTDFTVTKTNGASPVEVLSVAPASSTDFILTTAARNGFYKVTVGADSIFGACNGVAVTPGFALVQDYVDLTLFTNHNWQYNATGTELASDWMSSGFNDTGAGWQTGAGLFYGTNVLPSITNLSGVAINTYFTCTNAGFPATNCPTFYFRTHVTMPDGFDPNPTNTIITMRYMVDDGMVVYVNGTEAFRTRNVTNDVNYAFANYLGGASVANATISTNVILDNSLFLDGDNVIAVYLKQVNGTSTDAAMDLELKAVIKNYATPPAEFIVTATQSATNLAACGSVTFTATKEFGGKSPFFYQWFKGATALTGKTNTTLTISPAHPSDAGSYHVRVTDSATTPYVATSGDVTITVASDVPAALSALSEPDLRTITVAFDRPIAIGSAVGGDFTITPAITVSSSVVTNSTNVIIKTATDLARVNYTIAPKSTVVSACTSQSVTPATLGLVQQIVLSSPTVNINWQYNQAAVDLGSAWLVNSYDDHGAGWQTGAQVFDVKFNNARTEIVTGGVTNLVATHLMLTNEAVLGTNSIPSSYFRQHFTCPVYPTNMTLKFRTFFDDYGVVYVNGTEVYRDTNIVSTNFAFAEFVNLGGSRDASWLTKTMPTTSLVKGDNVLAVYLKQYNNGSSDITMGLELIALVNNFPPTGPTLTITDNGTTVTVGWANPTGGTLWYSTDLINWTQGTTQNPQNVTKGAVPYKFFEVRQNP
jgi:hypothetical protein